MTASTTILVFDWALSTLGYGLVLGLIIGIIVYVISLDK